MTAKPFKVKNGLIVDDSDKIQLGNDNDLQIYHDGSNSYLVENGTGDLYQQANNSFYFQQVGGAETYAKFTKNGSCEFYYDNSKKVETTSAGATVTGTLTATAFSGDGSALTGVGGNTPAFAVHAGGNTAISANTFTHINFGTELVDTDNAFASSAFTVPTGKGGRYFIGGVVVFDGLKDNVQLAVTVGGSDNYDGQNWRIVFGNDFQMASVSYVLNLSAGDVVRLGGETNSTTNLSSADSYSRTKFWGFKI